MKKILAFIIIIAALINVTTVKAQGCVAIRSTGGICAMQHPDSKDSSGWSLNINNRYYKSYKHYVGTEEQKLRADTGSNVINHSYTMDLALTKHFNNRFSMTVDLPIVSNARSSLYEHDRKNRYSTHSFGIGDIRVSAYYWLLNPKKSPNTNIQAGIGLKLATGDYKYQDFFHLTDSTTILGPVDQSIQPGDGGTGFTTEINAYHNFSNHVSIYGNFYYLFSPREQNGTSTTRGGVASATTIKYNTDVMSVPDQMMVRAGANFNFNKLTATTGVRYERLPAKDIIGGSKGFRRPGYILSAEPGVTYNLKKVSVYAFVPFAIVRDRIQSDSDIRRSNDTGTHIQGDAAFSDYTVNVGITIQL